jgi:hypothetical protein
MLSTRACACFLLGPEDIFWLNNVCYEIVQMRGRELIPAREQCRFFYPNLVRRNNIQPDHARAATLEMLTGPWIVLSYMHPKTNRNGYVIFYRRKGDSVPDFLYFIDYLMYYQLLQADTEVYIRTLETDLNAAAIFEKTVHEYVEQCENSYEIRGRLRAVKTALLDLYKIVPNEWLPPVHGFRVVSGRDWERVRDQSLIAVEMLFYEFRAFLGMSKSDTRRKFAESVLAAIHLLTLLACQQAASHCGNSEQLRAATRMPE